MKVLVASHTYIVDLNRDKFRALARLRPDNEVTVVVPRRWKPGGVQKETVKTTYLEEDSFRVVPVSNFSQNNQGLLSFGADIIPLLRDFRPDVIQVEQGAKSVGYAELITLNRLLGLKAKNVFFTWWNLPYELKWPVSLIEGYNLDRSDGIVVGNRDGADILRDRGYRGPIKITPQLGVDESLFAPQPQPELRQQLGIAETDFVVGFVGRFVEEKGLLTLGNALAGLRDLPWKWMLLGRGPLEAQLKQWAAENEVSDRLIWVESVPHDAVPNYINAMQVLLLPSETTYQFKTLTAVGWKEQFGHVLIEAMACGVPVVGSDSGEIPHVIGEAGLVFPEGNVEELRSRLRQLMESPELAADLSKKGYDRAMKQYTNAALARELDGFYRQLLD